MKIRKFCTSLPGRGASLLAATIALSALAAAAESERSVLVLTSTNSANANGVAVFRLASGAGASLSLVDTLPTNGKGGAAGNAGILQFQGDLGAVANYGSNSVTRLAREGDVISVAGAVTLAPGCVAPDSVALGRDHLFIVGANCAESHAWPAGPLDGLVAVTDASAAQIAVGASWAAVTLKSGSLLQLPLTQQGSLSGGVAVVNLPPSADNTPLGEAFWGNILGFTPAHSPDSFAIVNEGRDVFPITGPTPAFPSNAPCWVAKGPGSVWYTANSPGHAVSIFLSDGEGGVFYKSVALPGAPTDITVSRDHAWLAVIYSSGGSAYVAVFAIDAYGDLTPVATSNPIGVAAFNGVAISE